MAANGVGKGEARASSKSGLLDLNAVKDTLKADKKKKITLKIKKPVPKPSIAGNWKESETTSTSPAARVLNRCMPRHSLQTIG
jgi:SAGA-associated factor 73